MKTFCETVNLWRVLDGRQLEAAFLAVLVPREGGRGNAFAEQSSGVVSVVDPPHLLVGRQAARPKVRHELVLARNNGTNLCS
jgi:hypothetical protein